MSVTNYAEFMQSLDKLQQDLDKAVQTTINKTVNIGLAVSTSKTPIDDYKKDVFIMTHSGQQIHFEQKKALPQGGTLKKGWETTPAHKVGNEWRGDYHNNTYYGIYVNFGHRVVRNGVTIGWAPGKFFLEAGIVEAVERQPEIFRAELAKVKKKGGW